MADPTSDAKTHQKLECRVSILVPGQGQEIGASGDKKRNYFSDNLIRSRCIDKVSKVSQSH